MTTRSLLALGAVLMLAAPAPAAPPPSPRPPESPWLWLASDAKEWRLPEVGRQVLIVDRTTALVRTTDGRLMKLSLATGLAEPPVPVVQDLAQLEVLVRAGSRIFAFGREVLRPAVWEITLSPLSARQIAIDDPDQDTPKNGAWRAAASADGSRVVVCSPDRFPVVRDVGKRLASVKVLLDAPCGTPRFLDNDHVAFDDLSMTVEIGIADGSRVEHIALDPVVWRGPKGRTLTKTGDHITLRDARGTVLFDEDDYPYGAFRWTSDGRAVSARLGELLVYPRSPRAPRIPLPSDTLDFDIDDRIAVLVSGHQIFVVDLATGALRRPEGNSRSIHGVAVGGGTALVNSDRLREFAGGAQSAVGDHTIRQVAVGAVIGPVLTTGWDAITAWNPATGERRVVHELAGLGHLIARSAKEVAYDDGDVIYRRAAVGPERRWAHAHADATLAAIDLASETAVWTYKDAIRVADLARGQIASFTVPDRFGGCSTGTEVRALPGRRLAIDSLGVVHVYDHAGEWQATAAFDDPILSWDAGASGEIVLATATEIVLWSPRTRKAFAVTTGRAVEPHTLAVSADGKEIAVAFDDGSLAYTTVERVRARATPKAMEPVELAPCAAPAKVSFDELVLDRGE